MKRVSPVDSPTKQLKAILAAEEHLLKAAHRWWLDLRPCSYSEADHIANPCVNSTSETEDGLALAVARLTKARKR